MRKLTIVPLIAIAARAGDPRRSRARRRAATITIGDNFFSPSSKTRSASGTRGEFDAGPGRRSHNVFKKSRPGGSDLHSDTTKRRASTSSTTAEHRAGSTAP